MNVSVYFRMAAPFLFSCVWYYEFKVFTKENVSQIVWRVNICTQYLQIRIV